MSNEQIDPTLKNQTTRGASAEPPVAAPAEKKEHPVSPRGQATLRILDQLLVAAKARRDDAREKLAAVQAGVDRATAEIEKLNERVGGAISTMIDEAGLEGKWTLDPSLTKFRKLEE